jgi:hypothetical protein
MSGLTGIAHEEYVAMMWQRFLLMNAASEPSPDGSYFLGEIGASRSDRGVDRWCPYSIAGGLK